MAASYPHQELCFAARMGRFQDLSRLVEGNADVNYKTYFYSPLHIVSGSGDVQIVKYLIENKANVNMIVENDQTPLHWAARNNQANIIQLLVAANANVNAKDFSQQTPLHLAVLRRGRQAIQELIEANADVDAENKRGDTPIQEAARVQGSTDGTTLSEFIESLTPLVKCAIEK